jgi:hypothetical protein
MGGMPGMGGMGGMPPMDDSTTDPNVGPKIDQLD